MYAHFNLTFCTGMALVYCMKGISGVYTCQRNINQSGKGIDTEESTRKRKGIGPYHYPSVDHASSGIRRGHDLLVFPVQPRRS